MQKTLYILRHAKAEAALSGQDDHARALEAQGVAEAGALGEYLAKRKISPDAVICSTSARTRQTLELLGLQAGNVAYDDKLYLASAKQLVQVVAGLPEGAASVMLVGHNPGLHSLCLMLAGEGKPHLISQMATAFPPCAMATITFNAGSWNDAAPGEGTLADFVVPALAGA